MPSVKLENKTARILMIGLGGGGTLTVPPSDPTTGIGATIVRMTGDERARFDTAVATPAVQEWIDAEELVISDAPDAPDAPAPPSAARPVPEPEGEDKPPARTARPAEPERKHKHFFGGDKDKGEP